MCDTESGPTGMQNGDFCSFETGLGGKSDAPTPLPPPVFTCSGIHVMTVQRSGAGEELGVRSVPTSES